MFGWSAGDLLQFARLANEVYSYYQSVPQNLRDSLQRLQYIANDLTELSGVLENSGWPSYDRAPKLRDDLEEAKRFFARYSSLSTAKAASIARFLDTIRLGVGRE